MFRSDPEDNMFFKEELKNSRHLYSDSDFAPELCFYFYGSVGRSRNLDGVVLQIVKEKIQHNLTKEGECYWRVIFYAIFGQVGPKKTPDYLNKNR